MSAILKLDKMPTSCRDCPIFSNCKLYNPIYDKMRHPQCPLQVGTIISESSRTELLEALERLFNCALKQDVFIANDNFIIIKSALGGKINV